MRKDMKAHYLIGIVTLLCSGMLNAAYKTETLILDNTRLHVTHWTTLNSDEKPSDNSPKMETVILLSGPTDNWNSDSAWFARLAPKLSKKYNVLSLDRAGQVFADKRSKLGYVEFGKHLFEALLELNLTKITFISFASSNISLLKLTQLNETLPEDSRLHIDKIVLIDPDVLTPYSISRYSKDAKPFKENLVAYTKYISEGKYQQRATEKNLAELKHLKELSKDDSDTNWSYVELLFNKRLEINNIINLFAEVAIYDEDLESVKNLSFPPEIPLVIFDTNFEQSYIDNTENEQEKIDLNRWKVEAKNYYQTLVNHSSKGEYIELPTKEHLLPFSQPKLIIERL